MPDFGIMETLAAIGSTIAEGATAIGSTVATGAEALGSTLGLTGAGTAAGTAAGTGAAAGGTALATAAPTSILPAAGIGSGAGLGAAGAGAAAGTAGLAGGLDAALTGGEAVGGALGLGGDLAAGAGGAGALDTALSGGALGASSGASALGATAPGAGAVTAAPSIGATAMGAEGIAAPSTVSSTIDAFLADPSLGTFGKALLTNAPEITSLAGLGQAAATGLGGKTAEQKRLESLAQGLAGQASTDLSGQLSPAMQGGIHSAAESAKAAMRTHFASMGLSGSSSEAQALANIDQTAAFQGAQLAQQIMNRGVQESGMASELYQALMKNAMEQEQDLMTSLGRFSTALAGGNPYATQPQPRA